jgi:restriction endonuclease S subunit
MKDGWNLEKVASKVEFIFGFPFPSDSFNYDKGHPVVKIGNVKSGTTDTLVDYDWVEKAKVIKGDIIFGMSGDFNISKWKSEDALLNQRTCAIRNKTNDDYVSFLFYALEQPLKELNDTTQAAMIKNLSAQQLRSLKIKFPPIETAAKIVSFLDERTGKIDALVEEFAKFKANLQLQKRSLVSECATKGLPSERDRAYKDSGVEWLGEVPASWEISKGVRMFTAQKGKRAALLSAEWCGDHLGEYPVYSGKTEDEGVMARIDSFDFDYGDDGVLFSTTVGAKAMTVMHLKNKFSLSQNCLIMSPITDMNIRYYFYTIQPAFDYAKSFIPSHMQPSFRIADFYQHMLPVPPLDEQERIADYLDVECAKIDALIGEIDNQVNLLKTYRKSLINEAVTGKIEV